MPAAGSFSDFPIEVQLQLHSFVHDHLAINEAMT